MVNTVIKLKIRNLNRGKENRLLEISNEFYRCADFHLKVVKDTKCTNPSIIHKCCYKKARKLFNLRAATIQRAREEAISVYRGFLARRFKNQKTKSPSFKNPMPVSFAVQDIKICPDRSVIRVSTPDGFLWLPLILDSNSKDLIRHHKYGVSKILKKGDSWYFYLTIKREDVPAVDSKKHFGLDLGLANLVVLAGPKVVRFFSGKRLRFIREKYLRYRQTLQKKKKIGMVKRSKGKESNWARNENHLISKRIVDLVAANRGVLHVERLVGIRERIKSTKKINRMIHSWSFSQLLGFIKYKAALAGVKVIEEDPRHTSQMCSKCGHIDPKNRPKQALFRCRNCQYEIHADLNAARNLAAKGV